MYRQIIVAVSNWAYDELVIKELDINELELIVWKSDVSCDCETMSNQEEPNKIRGKIRVASNIGEEMVHLELNVENGVLYKTLPVLT